VIYHGVIVRAQTFFVPQGPDDSIGVSRAVSAVPLGLVLETGLDTQQ
jgi:hypothetical protein